MTPALNSPILKLQCQVQHYEWGIKGMEGKVAVFSREHNIPIDHSKPYAELWMGTHHHGPSKVSTSELDLDQFLLQNNSNSTSLLLGKQVVEKYGEIPFLLKVLSIQKPLSIQAHPDKARAQRLHAEKPSLYGDRNHKPEMAIALTDFWALCGFRPLDEITENLIKYPEIQEICGLVVEIRTKEKLKEAFKYMMRSSSSQIEIAMQSLYRKLETMEEKTISKEEKLFLQLADEFGNDLKEGEGLFVGANEPHAYLKGEIVECMACSDNVVRAGLTSKFKDIEELLEMLEYNSSYPSEHFVIPQEYQNHSVVYQAPCDEFSVCRVRMKNTEEREVLPAVNGPSILIVTRGSMYLEVTEEIEVTAGQVYFIGANTSVVLRSNAFNTEAFCAYCHIPTSE